MTVIDKLYETIPGMLVADYWDLDKTKIALSVNGITLATIKAREDLELHEYPWLTYIVPAESSSALSYVAYELAQGSLFLIYRTSEEYLYEFKEIAFEDFAGVLFEPSLGSAIFKLVRGKESTKIETPAQLLIRLSQ